MPIHKLSKRKIDHAAAGRHTDGGGLTLVVSNIGSKKWALRYTYDGKQHEMGLGSLRDLNLEQARAISGKYRAMAKEGIDPRIARAQAREKNRQTSKNIKKHLATIPTFTAAAARHIRTQRRAWDNHKHAKQWISTLKTYAIPVIGDKPVHAITIEHITAILNPIWHTKTETAKRVQARIENILDYASVHGYCDNNPARWRGNLDKILPRPARIKTVKHQSAMPYSQLPDFMAALENKKSISAAALQFLIFTATRTSEVLNATWDEIDLDQQVWTLPRVRMKNRKREHRVPLSRQAITVLRALPRIKGNPYLFPGARKGRPLSTMALLQLMRKMRYGTKGEKGHYVPHGFRSSFRDWAGEVTHYPSDVVEMALAHTIKNKVEAAYRRGDLFEKRRHLMQAWANEIDPRLELTLDPTERKYNK
ncbi:MAG: tyrosine-type recombinase/integrase [Candidatus Thiodiazotropha endolucinida]